MFYLSLTDCNLTIIKGERNIFGKEKIVACVKKDLPEGLIVEGEITDQEKLKAIFTTALQEGFPRPMKDDKISICAPNAGVYIDRLSINVIGEEDDATPQIIEKIKETVPFELKEWENYYKIIGQTAQTKEVLYSAIERRKIRDYLKFVDDLGLKLTFLSSSTFILSNLLGSLLKIFEKALVIDIDKKNLNALLFDNNGPIKTIKKKMTVKTVSIEFANLIKKFLEEGIKINLVILEGEGILDLDSKGLSEGTGIVVRKVHEVMSELLQQKKTELDTGGVTQGLFINNFGLLCLDDNQNVPNFIKDYQPSTEMNLNIAEKTVENTKSQIQQESKELTKEETQKETPIDNSFQKTTTSPTETEKLPANFLQKLLQKKILLPIFVFLVIILLVMIFVKQSKKTKISLPFISTSTPTPTVTLVPTMTPAPTIDLKLKRSDIKINVQNGTTTTGYAKEIASMLEKKGYKSPGKGNADKDDYEKSVLKVKEDKKQYTTLVISDLKEKVNISTIETLNKDSQYDLLIILGKN